MLSKRSSLAKDLALQSVIQDPRCKPLVPAIANDQKGSHPSAPRWAPRPATSSRSPPRSPPE
jgi:hypothetical protein